MRSTETKVLGLHLHTGHSSPTQLRLSEMNKSPELKETLTHTKTGNRQTVDTDRRSNNEIKPVTVI